MRVKYFLIVLGCFISSSLILLIPMIPAIENHTIQASIKSNIQEMIKIKNIENNLIINLNPIINIILLLLTFLKDLTDMFIAIMVSLFDYISDYLIEIENVVNDINNPLIRIIISLMIYIYIILMFTVLVLMVQFSGILITLSLILNNLFPFVL